MNRKQRRNAAKKLKAIQAIHTFKYPAGAAVKMALPIPVSEDDVLPEPSFMKPIADRLASSWKTSTTLNSPGSIPMPEGMSEDGVIPVPSFLSPLTKALEGGIRRGDLTVMGAFTPPMRGYMSAVMALRQHILNGDVKGTYTEPGLFEISMEAVANHPEPVIILEDFDTMSPDDVVRLTDKKDLGVHGGSGKIVMITEDPDPANDKNRADIVMDPVSIFSNWGNLPKAEGKIVWDESLDEFHARCQAIIDALPEDHPDKKRNVHMLDIDGDVIGGQFVAPKTRLESEVALVTGVVNYPDVTLDGVVYEVRSMTEHDRSVIHLDDPILAANDGWRRATMDLMIRQKPIPAGANGVTRRPLMPVVSFSLVDPQGDPSIPTIGVHGHFQQDSE